MSKNTTAVILVTLTLVGLGAWIGYELGDASSASGRGGASSWQEKHLLLKQQLKRLEQKHEKLKVALAGERSRRIALERRPVAQESTSVSTNLAASGEATKESGSERMADSGSVNWKNLHALFRKNAGLIADMSMLREEKKALEQHMTPEQMADLKELQAEWVKAAAQAYVLSEYPIIDSDLLPKILTASIGGLLDLSEEQLETLVGDVAQETPLKEELASATPLEAHCDRIRVMDRLEASLEEILEDEQLEAWRHMEKMIDPLLAGEPNYTRLGLAREKKHILDLLTRGWREHYGFTKETQDVLDEIGEQYLAQARDVLQRHGDPQGSLRKLDDDLRARIEGDFLALQLEFEKRLLRHATDEQALEIVGRIPRLFLFENSAAVSLRNGERVGF